jgi:hypothetical protein
MLIIVDGSLILLPILGLTLDGYVFKHSGRTLKDKEPVESLAGNYKKSITNSHLTS